jgi:hypothetical protein
MTEIETPDMPPDGAARYRVMVVEKQRVEAENAAIRGRLVVADAEVVVLRRALGLAPRRDDISRDAVEPSAEGRHDLGTAEGEEGGGPRNL